MTGEKENIHFATSIRSAMLYTQVATLFLKILRQRPELPMTEKSALSSIIAKSQNWIKAKQEYMKTRHPHLAEQLDRDLDLDGDLVGDLALVCDLLANNPDSSKWIQNFITQSKCEATLKKYHECIANGNTHDEAFQKLL